MSVNQADIAATKKRQLIIENSPEIRELRRQLATAYNRHLLDVKIATDRANLIQEKTIEKRVYDNAEQLLKKEEERLKEEERKKTKEKLQITNQLQQQMLDRRKRELEERHESALYAEAVKHKMLAEQQEEIRQAEKRRLEMIRLQEEHMTFLSFQKARKEQEKLESEYADEHLRSELGRLAKRDSEQAHHKEMRICAAETKKKIVATYIEKLTNDRQKTEELLERLALAEKEKMEEQRLKEEREVEQMKRKNRRINLEEILSRKEHTMREMKLIDSEYARKMSKEVEASVQREKCDEEEKRRIRTAVRLDNQRLSQHQAGLKQCNKVSERMLDMAAEEVETHRIKVVKEERLRLLRSIDTSIFERLPRGCLDEDDLINLNK